MAGDQSIKRRSLAANSLFSALAWIMPLLLGFITTPILVRNLGDSEYGIFAMVLGFISYSFTFGVGKVAGKYVPEFQAAGEPEKVTQAVSATFWFSLIIGLLGSSTLVLLAPFFVSKVLLVSPELQPEAIYALYLAGAIGVVWMLSQVFQFVLQGLHRFDNYVALTNLSSLLMGVGNIVLAKSGFGVVALLAWNLTTLTAIGLLFYVRSKHELPSIRLFTTIPRDLLRSVVRYGSSIILYQIFGNILFVFERSWVMRKFGEHALTFYFIPMMLAIYLHGFIASLVQAMFPVVNELLNDRERVVNLYRRANKVVLAIVAFTVTNFIACGELFLSLWVSPELAAASYPLLIPHGLTFGIIAIGILAFQLAEAYRFPALNVIMTATWMLVSIPLMVITADHWQSVGIAWSRLAGPVLTLPMIAYAERRALGSVQMRFWLSNGVRVLVAAVAMGYVEYLAQRMIPGTYVTLFAAGAIGSIVFAGIIVLTGYFSSEDRERFLMIFNRRKAVE